MQVTEPWREGKEQDAHSAAHAKNIHLFLLATVHSFISGSNSHHVLERESMQRLLLPFLSSFPTRPLKEDDEQQQKVTVAAGPEGATDWQQCPYWGTGLKRCPMLSLTHNQPCI